MSKKKVRLLVVDGDDDYFHLLEEYAELCSHQYDIECKHSCTGTEALSAIKSWTPSLILLDAHIPDINGFELLDRCRPRAASIVVMSDSPSLEIEESARERGADGYLTKNENPDDMELVLELLVDLAEDGVPAH